MATAPRIKRFLIGLGVSAWVVGAVGGTYWFNSYSNTPGVSGQAAQSWPSATTIVRAAEAPTLVVALHPECPCSRATLSELRSVTPNVPRGTKVVFLFAKAAPDRTTEESELFQSAERISQGNCFADTSDSEFERFGFATSGEVQVFRADGKLIFSGGITGSRGHVGDNPGRQALITALGQAQRRDVAAVQTTPVFGCALN